MLVGSESLIDDFSKSGHSPVKGKAPTPQTGAERQPASRLEAVGPGNKKKVYYLDTINGLAHE